MNPTIRALAVCLTFAALPLEAADAPKAPAAPPKAEASAPKTNPMPPADLKTPAAATPENAAFFLGEWTLEVEGPNGPASLQLMLKSEAGKITGSVSSEMTPQQAFTEIVRQGTGLVMSYSFDFQDMAINAQATLTPAGDKVGARLSFADGAFVMEGSAVRKAK